MNLSNESDDLATANRDDPISTVPASENDPSKWITRIDPGSIGAPEYPTTLAEMKRKNNKTFAVVMFVIVLGLAGGGGFKAYNQHKTQECANKHVFNGKTC
jgi:hypothetical protein